MPTGSEQRWRLLSEVFSPELQLMLLPPQLLLRTDTTTILLGPTWERKTQGMKLAGWLAGWLAGDDDEAATVIRQSVPAECGSAASSRSNLQRRRQRKKVLIYEISNSRCGFHNPKVHPRKEKRVQEKRRGDLMRQ
jgi:hypothetical protein